MNKPSAQPDSGPLATASVDNLHAAGHAPRDTSAALLAFARFLDREKVPWCLVGDTRGFPDRITGDVDVVVDPSVLPRLHQLIPQFCREQGMRLVQMLKHEQTAYYFVAAWRDSSERLQFLILDICGDYYRMGSPLLEAHQILEDRVPAVDDRGLPKGFLVPAPHMELIYYLLKKIDKSDLQARHGEHLSAQWTRDPARCEAEIRRFWPEEQATQMAQSAAAGSWEPITESLPRFRSTLRQRLSFRPGAALGEGARIIRRICQPTGLMVTLLGPDGSGKSSVLGQVEKSLAPAFRRTANYHLRPMLLTRGEVTHTPVTDPHAKPPRGLLASWAKLAFWWADYTGGYWLRIRPRLVRSTFVLFDRYFQDLLVDPRRYRYGASLALAKLAARLAPQPNLWIYLDVPAEVLQARKAEVPLEESARQGKAYQRLMETLRHTRVVDAARPLEQVTATVEDSVLEHLENRTLKRLQHGV